MAGIRFQGNGSGTGLLATAAVDALDCEFIGWDTAMAAEQGAWITPIQCTFRNNRIGLHYDSLTCTRNNFTFNNNSFFDNETAVLLSDVPGDHTLNFLECVFSGNGTDIQNLSGCGVDTTSASFD